MQRVETLGPEWLAHRYDEGADLIRFVDYDRQERGRVPFLIDQYLPAKPFQALARESARSAAPATAPIHYLFHSGFCCSTLLAACFDQPGLASGFSEPMILNDVVGWRGRGGEPAAVGRLLDDALGFLARPFTGDQAALVKPSTVVNGFAPAMMRLRPAARAVFIYAPITDFLTSIAKKGLDGRLWARELFLAMRREGLVQRLGFDDDAFFGQSDLQIAACAWLGQQDLFGELARTFPDRVRTIDSAQFLSTPEKVLRAAADHFGLSLQDDHLAAAVGERMKRNSKDFAHFDASDRAAEYRDAAAAHQDEIAKVAAWADAVADAAGIAMAPGSKLA